MEHISFMLRRIKCFFIGHIYPLTEDDFEHYFDLGWLKEKTCTRCYKSEKIKALGT